MDKVRAKALKALGNVSIKELREGPVYVIFVENPTGKVPDPDLSELFAPADVRVIWVDDLSKIKVFELEIKEK